MGTVALVGMVALVLAFAYGAYRVATRDRRKDAATNAAADALYRDDGPPSGEPSQAPKE